MDITLTLHIPREKNARLHELAARHGMSVEAVAAEVLTGFLEAWDAQVEADLERAVLAAKQQLANGGDKQ